MLILTVLFVVFVADRYQSVADFHDSTFGQIVYIKFEFHFSKFSRGWNTRVSVLATISVDREKSQTYDR